MTAPVTMGARVSVAPHHRVLPWLAVRLAMVIAAQPPARIRRIMTRLRAGARPATTVEAARARSLVVTVSSTCAGEGCLPRSIATALLCRASGTWPTWCSGVRVMPFLGHAWVEVDGEPVDEPYPAGYHRALIKVPPAGAR
ncbi:lasso peptide biosynthesis B2 protein [Actinokineospora sp. NBRC 105648]|uniref:lasso peptide biosynthesis B2 protein n=1 Tax=Actinokineospora sp. NBRC 105648 TaxID=3032206 RepID=UPI0024A39708|nr:lasso peptide biosynthesis B2 protein [Actinokineospora sp. NBRC 105648]GLZ39364.1 hypothetical protein Acsp05_29880 [Actinokineospora sp. NBRC 105648]